MELNSETMQVMYDKIDEIHKFVMNKKNDYPLPDRWLDITDTCKILNVSKRTLQAYRDKGVLPFSQIVGKIYFKAADIQKHLEKHYRK